MGKNKECDIYIGQFGLDDNCYAVYSDLAPWQIEGVEGVVDVSATLRDEGYLIVTRDKRYNHKKVLADIRQLVEKGKPKEKFSLKTLIFGRS